MHDSQAKLTSSDLYQLVRAKYHRTGLRIPQRSGIPQFAGIARLLSRAATVALLAVPSTLVIGGAASASLPAGQVGIEGSTLRYTAKAGQINVVSIAQSGSWIVVDDVYALTAGSGCVSLDNSKVECIASAVTFIDVDLADGGDSLTKTTTISGWLEGGPGNDTIHAGGATTLWGNNWVLGGDGNDTLYGGPNADVINGGHGQDYMSGQAGRDSVTYSGRTENIFADLDGAPNDDGALFEGDTIAADVEVLFGGDGNDTLTGNGGDNQLGGYGGHDTLRGLGGDDYLAGHGGNDTLDGGGGADELSGGDDYDTVTYAGRLVSVTADLDGVTGDDGALFEGDSIGDDVENLIGGEGADVLSGNSNSNRLTGGNGDDVLNGLDGADILDGGLGDDIMNGGTGNDTVDYSSRTQTVIVNLDGAIGNDGEQGIGEADTVPLDVENIRGGTGTDLLTGSASINMIFTNGGNDIVKGLGGDDRLEGTFAGAADGGTGYDRCYNFDTTQNCEQLVEPPK